MGFSVTVVSVFLAVVTKVVTTFGFFVTIGALVMGLTILDGEAAKCLRNCLHAQKGIGTQRNYKFQLLYEFWVLKNRFKLTLTFLAATSNASASVAGAKKQTIRPKSRRKVGPASCRSLSLIARWLI